MARRIEFLAPVEAMRGNLSGKQVLKYPTKDNSAWEAPSDKKSYATNYNTRYIGSKVSATGLKHFSVRQRSAIMNSPAQRQAQALLAASKLLTDAVLKNIQWAVPIARNFLEFWRDGNYDAMQPAFISSDRGATLSATIRRYFMRNIRELLLQPKAELLTFIPRTGSNMLLSNPWNKSTNASAYTPNLPQDQLVKFWAQLAQFGTYFYIGNSKSYVGINRLEGAGAPDFSFTELIGGSETPFTPNVLSLTASSSGHVKFGEYYLLNANGEHVDVDDAPADGDVFTLTTASPNP